MKAIHALASVAIIQLWMVTASMGAGGDITWTNVFDLEAGHDEALAVATQGNSVFVAGNGRNNTLRSTDYLVRAHNAKDGTVLWEDQLDGSGLPEAAGLDEARAIATRGGRVFAAGRVSNTSSNTDFFVRAYKAKDGTVLWEDQVDGAGAGADQASAALVAGRRVFAAGHVTNVASNRDFLVRAYGAGTGELLWQDQLDGGGNNLDEALALAAKGARVFACGRVTIASGNTNFFVRAYNAADGTVLWDDEVDGFGFADQATTLAVRGGQVYAAGFRRTAAGDADFYVRAYDAGTGTVLWEDQLDEAAGSDQVFGITARGSRVYAAGNVTNSSGDRDFIVRAYDATTGGLLWEDQVAGAVAGLDEARGCVAARGGRVIAVGRVRDTANNDDILVRAYDGATGAVEWENQFDMTGRNDLGAAVATRGASVFVVGRSTNSSDIRDMLTLALDLD